MIRAVLDTNLFVRALLKPRGSVGTLLKALRDRRYVILYSQPIIDEIVEVLARPRMRNKYGITGGDIRDLVSLVALCGEEVEPTEVIEACRDPKDDKFLEAALSGRADALVTGDEDLLVLHPFHGIPIIRPWQFMRLLDDEPDSPAESDSGGDI